MLIEEMDGRLSGRSAVAVQEAKPKVYLDSEHVTGVGSRSHLIDRRCQLPCMGSPSKKHDSLRALLCARGTETFSDGVENRVGKLIPTLFRVRGGLIKAPGSVVLVEIQLIAAEGLTSCARTVSAVFNSRTPCSAQLVRSLPRKSPSGTLFQE